MGGKRGFSWRCQTDADGGTSVMMTIDQNEQTAARKEGGREAASELSGVTDSPLPLLRSTYLVRRQKPKASCPALTITRAVAAAASPSRSSRHFARSMADHRLRGKKSMGHKPEATRADRSRAGIEAQAACRSRTNADVD